jgi:choline dehydrogenase
MTAAAAVDGAEPAGRVCPFGPEQTSANLEYHVQPLSLERFGEPLHAFPAFTASVCDLRPQSRGRIDIRSADPQDAPLIQPNYLSHPEDLRVAADAIRLTRRIVAAPALKAFKPVEYLPGDACKAKKNCTKPPRESARRSSTRSAPAAWAMTRRGGRCQLRVHGVPGLRIADASIMPRITSGNTCSPTLMIAEKAAQLILNPTKACTPPDTKPPGSPLPATRPRALAPTNAHRNQGARKQWNNKNNHCEGYRYVRTRSALGGAAAHQQ